MLENKEDIDVLEELVSMDIPSPKKPTDGFLEIIGKSHHENINSRVYGYFLNQEKNPEISQLFLEALLTILEEKTNKSFLIKNYKVLLEEGVIQKGKESKARIDICLHSSEEKKAIIIENKIYHHLLNPLEDYWKHYNYDAENKIGIILTLNKEPIPEEQKGQFVNVTHIEWINRVQEIGFPSNLSAKNEIYLLDFCQTIKNLTNELKMNDSIKFYFNNAEQIEKALETRNESLKFFLKQLKYTGELQNIQLTGSADDYRYLWKETDIGYTIIYNKFFTKEKTIRIVIEAIGNKMKKLISLKPEKFTQMGHKNFDYDTNNRGGYIHFAFKDYTVSINEFENLGEVIHKHIISDFEPLMNDIKKEIN